MLDFSLDNDWERDSNGSYTYASLQKDNFPSSFTICAAFMVEDWGAVAVNSPLFLLRGSKHELWMFVELLAFPAYHSTRAYPEFTIHFSGQQFTTTYPFTFFPMHWIRVCISFDSNSSIATFAVNGKIIEEKKIFVDTKPDNVNLILGLGDAHQESPGKITDVNIFSAPLTNISMGSPPEKFSSPCHCPNYIPAHAIILGNFANFFADKISFNPLPLNEQGDCQNF